MKRTQRQRAEDWARACVWRTSDGALVLTLGDGRATHLGGNEAPSPVSFSSEAVESVRRILVGTWLRARRAQP